MRTELQGKLSLRPVCIANAEAVAGLSVHEAQGAFIAANTESLALAAEHVNMHPRAIHLGAELVGFALHAGPGSTGRQDTHVLYRLMIAAGWQGLGLGRAALGLLLAEIRALGAARVVLYYVPSNTVARQLYVSAGFVEQGVDADGEMMAVLELARS